MRKNNFINLTPINKWINNPYPINPEICFIRRSIGQENHDGGEDQGNVQNIVNDTHDDEF